MELRGLWIFLFVFIFWANESVFSQDKKEKSSDSDSFVKEIEPGVKLYGTVSEFSEVGSTNAFDIDPNGGKIAFALAQEVKIWDIEKGKVVEKIKNSFNIQHIRYSGDGLSLVVMGYGSGGSELSVFDVITSELKSSIKVKEALEDDDPNQNVHMQAMALSTDDEKIAVGGSQTSFVFELDSGKFIKKLTHSRYSQAICFTGDGSGIIDSAGDIYDVDSGEKVGKLPGSTFGQRYIQQIEVNPRFGTVALAAWNQGVELYDLESKKKIELDIKDESNFFYRMGFSGNGKLLAATTYPLNRLGTGASSDSKLYVWEAKSGKLKNVIELPFVNSQSLRFSSDNESVYVQQVGQIGVTQIQLDEKKVTQAVGWHQSPIGHIGFMPGDETIYAAPHQGNVVIHDAESGEPKKTVKATQANQMVVGGEDSGVIIAAGYNASQILHAKTGRTKNLKVQSFRRPSMISALGGFLSRKKDKATFENFAVNSIVVDEGKEAFYLTMRSSKGFRVDKYDLKSGKNIERRKFRMSEFIEVKSDDPDNQNYAGSQMQWRLWSSTVSPNGRFFTIVDDQRRVHLIDLESESLVKVLSGWDENSWPGVQFTPDGSKLLVVGGKKILVYDGESGEELFDLGLRLESFKASIAINTKVGRIVAVAGDGEVTVFDLEDGHKVFSKKLKDTNQTIGISEDGQKLVLGKNNCQFEVWDLETLITD